MTVGIPMFNTHPETIIPGVAPGSQTLSYGVQTGPATVGGGIDPKMLMMLGALGKSIGQQGGAPQMPIPAAHPMPQVQSQPLQIPGPVGQGGGMTGGAPMQMAQGIPGMGVHPAMMGGGGMLPAILAGLR